MARTRPENAQRQHSQSGTEKDTIWKKEARTAKDDMAIDSNGRAEREGAVMGEREAGKNLRAELKRRRDEGEQNLAICRNQIITLKETEPEPPTLVDTLTNKMNEMLLLTGQYILDVIMVTEVKPKHSTEPTSEPMISLKGYLSYTNLDAGSHRGIAIYVSNSIDHLVTEISLNTTYEETIWLNIKLKGKDKLLLGCVYRSPSSTGQNNIKLFNLLQQIPEYDSTHTAIAGDFNYPEIEWTAWSTTKPEENHSQKVIDACRDTYLHQHTIQPTRHRHCQNESLLDLVFTNEEQMVLSIDYLPGLGISDHAVIIFNVHVYTPTTGQAQPKYRYHKCNYSSMNDQLNDVDWSLMDNLSVQEAWTFSTPPMRRL
ncbi:hypothetical protein LSH36_534g01000 [Paralvinella palmiformis]|uniref:Endonuclease/exonuclease/phosphatase domain-containing protein n=1 Tax=Paralvinella palmiformis TaxID=53620 RepID=A0AAD9J821_9ANNE|nr:hypothetical protein LSH36_534g01000 [Paralvinella palmiformis]